MTSLHTTFALFTTLLAIACRQPKKQEAATNPFVYVEIPVTDMKRATEFYGHVFGYRFSRTVIDGNEMALFPFSENQKGITGALAKGSVYRPAQTGSLVYFFTANLEATLARAAQKGAAILYPKTDIGEQGFVAEIADSEGNRIALHQNK